MSRRRRFPPGASAARRFPTNHACEPAAPHDSLPPAPWVERRQEQKEHSPEQSSVSDRRIGRGRAGGAAVGLGMSLPLRGSVEDQAQRLPPRCDVEVGESGEEFTATPFLRRPRARWRASSMRWCPTSTAASGCRSRSTRRTRKVDRQRRDRRSLGSDPAGVRRVLSAEVADAERRRQAKLAKDAEETYKKFHKQLDEYLKENVDDIAAYFGSLDRFENDQERDQDAPFQKQRRWDRMMELRGEADKWIKDIEGQERAYAHSLYSLLDDEQKQRGLLTAELESVPMGSDEADRLRRDVRVDGHRAVPDARALHAAGGLGRGTWGSEMVRFPLLASEVEGWLLDTFPRVSRSHDSKWRANSGSRSCRVVHCSCVKR